MNGNYEVGKKVCFVDGKICPFSLSKPYERKGCIKDACLLFDINEQDCLVHLNLKEMWRRL